MYTGFQQLRNSNIYRRIIRINCDTRSCPTTANKIDHDGQQAGNIFVSYKKTKLVFAIYRKHTQTGIIITYDTCYPYEHEIPNINYLHVMNRVHTYPVRKEARGKEVNIKKADYITMNMI
jgi:hypothetical protein